MKKTIRNIILSLVVILVSFYIILPPLNPTSIAFWGYIAFLAIIIAFIVFLPSILPNVTITEKGYGLSKRAYHVTKNITIGVMGVVALLIIMNVVLSPLFNSKSYSKRITISEDHQFTQDVAKVNFENLPLLDKDSSQKLGDRVMGEMPELVSQFDVSDVYTQINYNDKIMRVTPLEYNGLVKYFTNRKNGVKGYITVNSVNGDANLIKLDKGMKYMPSAYFFENLNRKLRFSYPTEIFGEESFEIDNEGNPYWIIPTIKYTGINLKQEINGVIIFNPIDGTSKKYKVQDVPTWVDHVYSASLIIEQINDWGKYKNGFINSIFGQRNVVRATTGYNYTVMNDDVYLYTGITSVSNDQSNIGFILSNMRTKETAFYAVPGAEEYSAMASAVGQVQQMNYTASFPLLINLNDKATYLISLKDNAGLVKMYAFVDVADYQKVVVSDAAKGIEEAARNYLGKEGINIDTDKMKKKTVEVSSITSASINGNTYYYITDKSNQKYRVSISVQDKKLPFVKKGDSLDLVYLEEADVIEIVKITNL